jgi:hypothetical protein
VLSRRDDEGRKEYQVGDTMHFTVKRYGQECV